MSTLQTASAVETSDGLYRAVWRWHFFAGVVVAPLLLILAASGLVMLARAPIETALYGDALTVAPANSRQTPNAQLAAVRAAFPNAQPTLFVPPVGPDRSSEFSVVESHGHVAGHGHNEAALSVYVDPYTARVIGTVDPARTPYGWANAIHGTLLLGDVGDAIVEIAAGLAVLLIISGLYLARPRRQAWRSVLLPPVSLAQRTRTRGLHGAIGYWIALPLLFFLLSGLTWTNVWGGRVVQAWSTVSLERNPAPRSTTHTHDDLNRGPLEEVPWALEQTPMPESGSLAGTPGFRPSAGSRSRGRIRRTRWIQALSCGIATRRQRHVDCVRLHPRWRCRRARR
ncbi:MAG: PepSY domain-containing protein [Gammaproteobacteria bacterium]|nr:PepSY domain-containing protein [Gammaproteobacteria bacterium]